MQKRVMGKASFCNILDQSGNIQSYVARDSIGEESYKDFKKMDIGDIVGLEGEVFKTKTGEISVHASSVKLLSKSLQILPEKWGGRPRKQWPLQIIYYTMAERGPQDDFSGFSKFLRQFLAERV